MCILADKQIAFWQASEQEVGARGAEDMETQVDIRDQIDEGN